MPTVQFTSNLKRFYPDLKETSVKAGTIAQLVDEVNKFFPGIKNYIVDDQNTLRDHVNIFINENMILDRIGLGDNIAAQDRIFIMQALSGG
ncbi:MAG: MoaD/ThiS family protein [Cytophagales bacterium]|nr:MoaD/ThiS family protein [Cytophagales bacterium]